MNLSKKVFHKITELPAKLTMITTATLDEPRAFLSSQESAFVKNIPLRIISAKGCEVCVLLEEKLLSCGTGRFFVELWDGCDKCGMLDLELSAACSITSSDIEISCETKECCDDDL